jgi:hypothetical protein
MGLLTGLALMGLAALLGLGAGMLLIALAWTASMRDPKRLRATLRRMHVAARSGLLHPSVPLCTCELCVFDQDATCRRRECGHPWRMHWQERCVAEGCDCTSFEPMPPAPPSEASS